MIDAEDNPNPSLTLLDKERLLDLEIGDSLETESGAAKIFRYKNEYVVSINLGDFELKEFKNIRDVVRYFDEFN